MFIFFYQFVVLSGQIGQVGAHAVLTSSLVIEHVSGPILTAQEHNVQGMIEFSGIAGDAQVNLKIFFINFMRFLLF